MKKTAIIIIMLMFLSTIFATYQVPKTDATYLTGQTIFKNSDLNRDAGSSITMQNTTNTIYGIKSLSPATDTYITRIDLMIENVSTVPLTGTIHLAIFNGGNVTNNGLMSASYPIAGAVPLSVSQNMNIAMEILPANVPVYVYFMFSNALVRANETYCISLIQDIPISIVSKLRIECSSTTGYNYYYSSDGGTSYTSPTSGKTPIITIYGDCETVSGSPNIGLPDSITTMTNKLDYSASNFNLASWAVAGTTVLGNDGYLYEVSFKIAGQKPYNEGILKGVFYDAVNMSSTTLTAKPNSNAKPTEYSTNIFRLQDLGTSQTTITFVFSCTNFLNSSKTYGVGFYVVGSFAPSIYLGESSTSTQQWFTTMNVVANTFSSASSMLSCQVLTTSFRDGLSYPFNVDFRLSGGAYSNTPLYPYIMYNRYGVEYELLYNTFRITQNINYNLDAIAYVYNVPNFNGSVMVYAMAQTPNVLLSNSLSNYALVYNTTMTNGIFHYVTQGQSISYQTLYNALYIVFINSTQNINNGFSFVFELPASGSGGSGGGGGGSAYPSIIPSGSETYIAIIIYIVSLVGMVYAFYRLHSPNVPFAIALGLMVATIICNVLNILGVFTYPIDAITVLLMFLVLYLGRH